MLSIDEAIARERNLAEIYRNDIVPKEDYHNMPWIDMANEGNEKAAEEHEQLAEWLRELKDYRDKNKWVVRIDIENMDSVKDKIEELSKYAESQYKKAIDECNKKLDELEINYESCFGTKIVEMYADVYEDFRAWLKEQK